MDYRELQNIKPEDCSLVITIKHDTPVDLSNLTAGLNALNAMYTKFNGNKKQAKFLVREVRKSSIEFDLISMINDTRHLLPLLSISPNVFQFGLYVGEIIKRLKTKNERGEEIREKLEDLSSSARKADDTSSLTVQEESEEVPQLDTANIIHPPVTDDVLKEVRRLVKIAAEQKGECDVRISGKTRSGMDVGVKIKFNSDEARLINHNVNKLIEPEIDTERYERRLFKWVQVHLRKTKTGTQGLIESIYTKPRRVIFSDDYIRDQMLAMPRIAKRFYIVDVEVERSAGTPKMYRITREYPEDSFVDDDEE